MTNAINLEAANQPLLENPSQSGVLNGRVYTYNRALFKEFALLLYHLFRTALSWLISYQTNILTAPCKQLDEGTLKLYFDFIQKESKGTFSPIYECLSIDNLKAMIENKNLGKILNRKISRILLEDTENQIRFLSLPVIVKGSFEDHIVSFFIDREKSTIDFFDSKGLPLSHPNNERARLVYESLEGFPGYQLNENPIRYQHPLDVYNCGAFTAMYTKMCVLNGPRVGGEMNVIDFRHRIMKKDLELRPQENFWDEAPDCQFP